MTNKLLIMTALLSLAPLSSFSADAPANNITDKAPVDKAPVDEAQKEEKAAVNQKADVTVKIGGSFKPQFGSVSPASDFKYLKPGKPDSDKLKNNTIVNETKLKFEIEANNIENIKYGALVKINVDHSATMPGDKIMAFIEGSLGRVETGSYDGIDDRLKVAPSRIARATGGIDGDASDWIKTGAFNIDDTIRADLTNLYYTSVFLPSANVSRSNKLSYYSPTFSGLSMGVSYVPDTELKGRVFNTRDENSPTFVTEKGLGFKDVIEAGVRYEAGIAEDLVLSLSALGEMGKAKKKDFAITVDDDPTISSTKALTRHNLCAFELGAMLDYKGLSVAGSYGGLGNSGGIKKVEKTQNAVVTDETDNFIKSGKKPRGNFWTLGVAYVFDALGVSATYYNSSTFGKPTFASAVGTPDYVDLSSIAASGHSNKFTALSLGLDYSIVPGMLAYAEYTNFKFSMDSEVLKAAPTIKTNKGHVILTGMKFEF